MDFCKMDFCRVALVFAVCYLCQVNGSENENRLFEKLFADYNPDVRPVKNTTASTIRLNFGLALVQIMDTDEWNSELTTKMWVRMNWKDEFMTWNSDDAGGIDTLYIPGKKLWKPDAVVYNSVQKESPLMDDTTAVVTNDGTVLWIPQAVIKSSCSYDMTHFPYDTQYCQIKVGSWVYDGFKLDIDFYDGLEEIDITDYISSNEWRLIGHAARKNVKYYPCCAEPYPDLTFTLQLQRIPGAVAYLHVTAVVLLAVLVPFIFLVPHSQSQRFSFGGCVLICLFIMLGIMKDMYNSPKAAVPLIAVYYFSMVILLVISFMVSAITANMADSAKEPPNIIKKVFVNWCGKVVRVSAKSEDPEEGSTEKKPSKAASDWSLVGKVLDRIFFVIYVILTIISSCALLL